MRKLLEAIFDENNYKDVIIFILAIGIFARLFYVVNMPYYMSGHDLGFYNDEERTLSQTGHLGYIKYIYENGILPKDNTYILSHPPLFHIMASFCMRVASIFSSDYEFLFESIQVLSFLISVFTLIIWKKILEELKLDYRVRILLFIMLSLNSYFIISSDAINNDALSILLALCSILFLIRWYNMPSFKNIIITAIFTGLAVMTKINMGMLCFPLLITFIWKFIIDMKAYHKEDKNIFYSHFKQYVLEFFVFAIISLGIRNVVSNKKQSVI